MSIQMYNQKIYLDNRRVNYNRRTGQVGQVPDLVEKNGMAMEFQVNIKGLYGGDKYAIRGTNFTCVADLTNAESGMDTVDNGLLALFEAGSRVASNIAFMSKGVIVGFFAKLGKYRQDEMPIDMSAGDNSYATLVLNNDNAGEYGSDICDRNSSMPVKPASTAIRVPWIRDNVSRQDVIDTLNDWKYTDTNTGIVVNLGNVKFYDEDKTELCAMPTTALKQVKVVERTRTLGVLLENNDASLGIVDNVESEKYNQFTEGDDDTTIQGGD